MACRADGSSDYDDNIIPRQELSKIQRETQENISIVIDETTTLEELEEVIAETASMDLLSNKDWYGRTPLQIALLESSNIEIIKLLIELQDDVDETLLLWALGNSPEIISFLLNAGASLNTVDNRVGGTHGMSVLRIAKVDKYASYDIFSKLIEMGWEENSDDKIIWQARGKTYLTTDNLRLRAEEGVSGNPLFTLPKDTPVHILSIGSIDKIDDIFAYWVEVAVVEDTVDTDGKEVKKGTSGWCFGGYLTNENIVK